MSGASRSPSGASSMEAKRVPAAPSFLALRPHHFWPRRSNGGGGGGSNGGGGGSGGGGSGGSGGGGGGVGGGSGGSTGSGGIGNSGTCGGGTGAWRGGLGGGQRQQQQRPSETQSPQQLREWLAQCGTSGGSDSCSYVIFTGVRAGQTCEKLHTQHRCFSRLDDAWRAEFGDDVELPRWADLLRSRIAIFDLDFDAILSAMYAMSIIAEGGCYRCVPPDLGIAAAALGASESGTLPSLHLPSFSTNLVSTAALQDAMVTTTTLGGQRVSICTCTRMGRHLATFTRRPGSSLYTMATEPPQVAASAQVSASSQVAASCSCCLLSHQTLLWHHRVGHPSLPRLRGMHSRLLVSGLPRSLPPLPPSPAPPCLPCVEGRQRAAPHSLSFPPTTAPLQTLHMDRFGQDLPVLRLHSDRGGDFSSSLLRDFCRAEGILQSFTLPDSPQKNGIAERRIGLFMEVARTSMIHAAAPNFLWPFAVRYAAHQLNLWPRVSLPKTSPTLHWTGKVGDASVFRVWGSRAFVRDTSADKLSACTILCIFIGFVPDAPSWQLYHPTSRRVFPSQDVTFDESVPSYRLPLPHPLPGTAPVQVAVGSGAAPGAASRGAASGSAEPGGAKSGGARSRGAEPGGEEPGGAERAGVETGGVEPGGAESEGAESMGAEPWGAALSGGPAGASSRPSPQQLREWFVLRARLRNGATGAGGAGDAGVGGARTRGTGAAATGGVGGAGAGDPTEPGTAGVGGNGAGGAGAGVAGPTRAGAVDPGAGGARDTVRPRQYFVSLLQQPASPLPAPSPYSEQSGSLIEDCEPASRPVSPVRSAHLVPCSRPPPVLGTHAMAFRPSSVPLRVPLPPPSESSLPKSVSASPPSVEGECALGTIVLEDRQEDFESLAATVPRFASMLLAHEGDPDAPDIPTPRSYAEAITGTYVNKVPPPGVNIVNGMWIFRVKRLSGSPPAFKGSLHEEIWLHRPPGFTELFPAGTQWSLWWRVYGLRQAPCEWHDTLRTTLAALGFAPAAADPSLFLRTDTSLPPFYVLVYIEDLVLQRFGFQFSLPQPTLLSSSHSLSAPSLDESVEPSGPYPELVGCLIAARVNCSSSSSSRASRASAFNSSASNASASNSSSSSSNATSARASSSSSSRLCKVSSSSAPNTTSPGSSSILGTSTSRTSSRSTFSNTSSSRNSSTSSSSGSSTSSSSSTTPKAKKPLT
ncbi:unnamed protein product [Closterium sp. NIES-54]